MGGLKKDTNVVKHVRMIPRVSFPGTVQRHGCELSIDFIYLFSLFATHKLQ